MKNNERTIDFYTKCLINHVSRKIIAGKFIINNLVDTKTQTRDPLGYFDCILNIFGERPIRLSVNKDYICWHGDLSILRNIDKRAIKIICDRVKKHLNEE